VVPKLGGTGTAEHFDVIGGAPVTEQVALVGTRRPARDRSIGKAGRYEEVLQVEGTQPLLSLERRRRGSQPEARAGLTKPGRADRPGQSPDGDLQRGARARRRCTPSAHRWYELPTRAATAAAAGDTCPVLTKYQ
jgi:hypothetical protein